MPKIDLYQGDCLTVMDDLIKQGVKVDAIITDPPYGTTACKWDSVIPFDKMWNRLNKLIIRGGEWKDRKYCSVWKSAFYFLTCNE